MKHLIACSSAALLVALSFTACGGDSFESGDGDAAGDGGGDSVGDGDGDTAGTGGTTSGTGGLPGGDGDGDDPMCTNIDVYALNVIVRGGASNSSARDAAPPATGGATDLILPPDPATGGTVATNDCAATVTAMDGKYLETLDCSVEGLDCKCIGAPGRPGTYTVTGVLGALVDSQENVVVESDECHPIPQTVVLFD